MRQKQFIKISAIFSAVMVLSACNLMPEDVFSAEGEIKFIQLEGGFFGITGADGRNFDPINLPTSFMEDGIHVQFQYKRRDDLASIHQWGELIEIVTLTRTGGGLLKTGAVVKDR